MDEDINVLEEFIEYYGYIKIFHKEDITVYINII